MQQPFVIQGGMGVGVSGWRLARTVAAAGQLGVVSGTALDTVHARLLQDGDPGGHLRRAYGAFPVPSVAERVLSRWYLDAGRPPKRPYRSVPRLTMAPSRSHLELLVVANFAEVHLAKEGHEGIVGINYLEKIQLATAPSAYGAMLAGVDVVLMGAGIPSQIPSILDDLARHRPVRTRIDVQGAQRGDDHAAAFDPAVIGAPPAELVRPSFVAIVSSVALARFLDRDPATRPDGFVVEGPTAGGHNAPPRGAVELDDRGQPRYGRRDEVDLDALAALGRPFWLAGSQGSPEALEEARAAGAAGIQVGTAFAFCRESGIEDDLRRRVLARVAAGDVEVLTDPLASPSGFPFKVASVPGSVSEGHVYAARRRVCDLGYLRSAYVDADGKVGYRCPAEPVESYVRKGGDRADTEGRKCLCNGLTATVGLGQSRPTGPEPTLVTAGDELLGLRRYLTDGCDGYSANDVLDHLLGDRAGALVSAPPAPTPR